MKKEMSEYYNEDNNILIVTTLVPLGFYGYSLRVGSFSDGFPPISSVGRLCCLLTVVDRTDEIIFWTVIESDLLWPYDWVFVGQLT